MARLLHIESSPRKDRSASIELARFFEEEYMKRHPGDRVETLDLWHTKLPEFDGETINAKYAILHGLSHTPAQRKAWQTVVETFEQFRSADKFLFSVPMWNFGIPYKLKHYVDIITQPTLSFSYSETTGYQGLVTGKPVAVIYARGGGYSDPESAPYDKQKPYVEDWLRFIGFTTIHPILVEPTLADPADVAKAKAAAREAVLRVLAQF